MSQQQSEAKKRFLDITFKHSTRSVDNFAQLMALAEMIVKAEGVGFKLDPDSVEKAVKNVLGVD